MPKFDDLISEFETKRCFIWDFDKTLVNLNADWERVKNDLSLLAKEIYHEDISFQPLWLGFKTIKDNYGKKLGKEVDWTPFNKIIEREENKAVKGCSELNEQGFYIFDMVYKKFIINSSTSSSIKIWNAICSNNFSSTLTMCAGKFDLFERIDYWVSREMVVKMKPNPEGIQKIFDYIYISSGIQLNKAQMVMFGDSDYDEQAAHNFGIDFYYIDKIEL